MAAQAGNPPPPDGGGRIDQAVIASLQTNHSTDYVLVFGKQADLSEAYQISGWVERGQYVVDALKETAERSQKRALAELKKRGLRYRSFSISNEIYVFGGDAPGLQAMLAFPEVAQVRAPVIVSLEPSGFRLRLAGPAAPQAQVQAFKAWGIIDTGADQFWSTYLRKGEGIVVANIDTGVDATHPALAASYRCAGGDLSDPACWSDPTGACKGTACDDHGHGTHTMGTMAADVSNGSTVPYTVGMAPGAQWIACKACTKDGICTDFDLLDCAEWILAPNGDSAERPHVVNNSWGDEKGGDSWFAAAVTAWRAAGIFPAFSAGNYSGCNTLSSPGDYQESFSSAAHNSLRTIASFSSKGASLFGHDPYTKPNISAPGVDILSTFPGGWGYMQGTSMASPHSAGAVALLWSCAPLLIGQIDDTFELLQSSADPAPEGSCDAPPDGEGNYTYGYGYLNVLAAGGNICNAGKLQGVVSDAVSGKPLEGATIRVWRDMLTPFITYTDSEGWYELLMPQGSYSLLAYKIPYSPRGLTNIQLEKDKVKTLNIQLQEGELLFLPLITNSAP